MKYVDLLYAMQFEVRWDAGTVFFCSVRYFMLCGLLLCCCVVVESICPSMIDDPLSQTLIDGQERIGKR
jgi:hypothetical protein